MVSGIWLSYLVPVRQGKLFIFSLDSLWLLSLYFLLVFRELASCLPMIKNETLATQVHLWGDAFRVTFGDRLSDREGVAKIARDVLGCWTKGEKYLILGSMESFIMYLSPYFPIAMSSALPSTIPFDYPTAYPY